MSERLADLSQKIWDHLQGEQEKVDEVLKWAFVVRDCPEPGERRANLQAMFYALEGLEVFRRNRRFAKEEAE